MSFLPSSDTLKGIRKGTTSTLVGTALGATAGYAIGSQLGDETSASTYIGGALGATVGLGAHMVVRNPIKALEVIGTPGYTLGKNVVKGIAKKGILGSLESIGDTVLKGADKVGKFATPLAEASGVALTKEVGELASIGRGMVKKSARNTIGYELNTFGKVAVGAGVLIGGLKNAFETHEKIHMGTSDGQITTATPGMKSSTMNYAGATGDLNFAMYANRRG